MAGHVEIVRLNYSTCEVHNINLTLARQEEWYSGFALKLWVDLLLFGLSLLLALCRLGLWSRPTRGTEVGPGNSQQGVGRWSHRLQWAPSNPPNREPLIRKITKKMSIVEPVESWWKSKMEGQPTVFLNYMRYLRICFFTFLCLFLIGYCLNLRTSVRTGWGLSMMFQRGKFYHEIVQGHSEGLQYLLVAVFLKGLVLLVATDFLERKFEQSVVSDAVRSTIWVHGLPVKDQRKTLFLRETFELSLEELKRVGKDLATVVDEQMGKGRGPEQIEKARTPSVHCEEEGEWVVDEWDSQLHPRGTTCDSAQYKGFWPVGDFIGAKGICFNPDDKRQAVFVRKVATQEASRVMRVWVVPNVKEWRRVSSELERVIGWQEAYDEWKLRYTSDRGNTCWNTALHSWFSWRSDTCKHRIQRLEVRLLEIRLHKMELNGCAFVQFRTPRDARKFLGKPPEKWDILRWWCWYKSLKFGHIPFSSVTLEYEPAPHPNDIIWNHMDTPRWCGWLAFHLLSCFVYVTMLLIVVSINLPTALEWLTQGDVYDCLSPLLLLIVNGSVVPCLVQWFTSSGMFWRTSDVEVRHFKFNFWLIIWSMVLVLLLRGSRLQHWLDMVLDGSFVQCMLWDLHLDPGELSLGYLVDVLFLTNAHQVLAFLRFRCQAQLRAWLLTARALDNCKLGPPRFPFSFHYAWTLSVIALSLWTSNAVPGILLLAAAYLLLKGCIDWCNLHVGVYVIAQEYDEGIFMNQVIFSLRIVVSLFWLTNGLTIWQLCWEGSEEEEGGKEGYTCPWWALFFARLLTILSLVLLGASLLCRAYADNIRRFIPGRLSEEPPGDEEEQPTPFVAKSATKKFFPTTSLKERPWEAKSGDADDTGLEWDARPPFRSRDVEDVMAAIRMRPSLEGPVFQGLREGKTVQEVLRQVRGFRRTCSGIL